MNLKELKITAENIVENLKNHGRYPRENDLVDYKWKLNISAGDKPVETFLKNFGKDILAFANADGGIMLIGIKEDRQTGSIEDLGLDQDNLDCLAKVDVNDVSQKFNRIIGRGISVELQPFQIGTRTYYRLLIEKSEDTLIPAQDNPDAGIVKGSIYYRDSGKTEQANHSTGEFSRFIQKKANEKSKEFMQIWSNLLPEMVEINPKEVLIINPNTQMVYGFNNKDKKLSGSSIDIEESQGGVFNVILNAISAGEIGKITNDEGKPIYKLVGTIYKEREHIVMSSLERAVNDQILFKCSNLQIKEVMHHLGWVGSKTFQVNNPPLGTVNSTHERFLWVETLDGLSGRTKVFFSPEAIDSIVAVINDDSCHQEVFGRTLVKK